MSQGGTDEVIKRALKEEEQAKKARKAAKAAQGRLPDDSQRGKDLESEEGGPIKESLVGMAQTKRAAKRKGGGVGDTDLVDDVERVEEELEVEEEDGIKLEAFNLKEERQRGYFDEAGNYVENEKDEEEDATDAWLASDEAKVVDEKTRKRIEEQQRRMEEADAAGPLTAVQLARLQWQVAQLLQPGETVARALKRLGGHAPRPGKRAKRGGGSGKSTTNEVAPDPEAQEKFNKLTEAASTLVDAGEADVYSQDRGYFERCAAVYIDIDEDERGTGVGGSKFLAGGVSKTAYEDADEDMFAEDNEDADQGNDKDSSLDKKGISAGASGPHGGAGGEGDVGNGKDKEERNVHGVDKTDYGSWPVKELKRFLIERGIDCSNIVEKGELVAAAKKAGAKNEGDKAAAMGSGSALAPPGYAFDPGSGLWRNTESGMYWDSKTGGFYNSSDGKWFSYSAQGQWVEWKV